MVRIPTVTSQLAFPLRVDDRGRYVVAPTAQHIEQMMIQVLLTAPGERVNRPDFGCGMKLRVFEPDNAALAATVRFDVTQSLQQWLGDVIDVSAVNAESDGEVLSIDIVYRIKGDAQVRALKVTT